MRERILFVGAVAQRQASFTSVCATFGISPKTGYKWLGQFEREGLDGLEDRSRRPHGNSRAMSGEVAERLVELRKAEPTWGPRKLVLWLGQLEPQWQLPAASSVGELLSRRGLITRPRERRRIHLPRASEPLRHATAPNKVWSMDFKGWFRVGDGRRCDPLTITDAYSRYLLCCDAQEEQFSQPVWRAMVRTFREYGLPEAIRVDNQQPWVAPKGELGITKLSINLLKLGIAVERIAPGKPQQNGRHERFHLTLKQDTLQPPANSLRSQQRRFDRFKHVYNHIRPHEALGQSPPATWFAPSRRMYPSKPPEPEYPSFYETCVVGRWGHLELRGVRYFASKALRDERVGLLEVEEDCYEVFIGKLLIGRIHAAHPELGMVAAA